MPAPVLCNVHGIRVEEKVLGYQLRCSLCKKKYGKGGTHVGAKDPEGGILGSCFATTNAKFWNRWEHWEIPRSQISAVVQYLSTNFLRRWNSVLSLPFSSYS
jgi:hypothetical protein